MLHDRATFVVEVEDFEGDDTEIKTFSEETGHGAVIYCIGTISDRGTITMIDFGYRSEAEARQTWPEALTLAQCLSRGLIAEDGAPDEDAA